MTSFFLALAGACTWVAYHTAMIPGDHIPVVGFCLMSAATCASAAMWVKV